MFRSSTPFTRFMVLPCGFFADRSEEMGRSVSWISPYKPSATYDWSGFYVGGQAGYRWGDVNVLDFGPVLDGGFKIDRTPFRTDGALAGGQISFQQQFGRWVAGVELSFSGGQLSDSASAERVQPFTLLSGDKIVRDEKDNLQARVGQLFLATARLGYSWDRWLAYGKGGFASAEIKTAFQANVLTTVVQGVQLPTGGTFAGQSSGSSSERHSGWTLGTGLEYMVTRNVAFGVEYNFINLQDRTQTAPPHYPRIYSERARTSPRRSPIVSNPTIFIW
jgi:outer membrane immunogenic protein